MSRRATRPARASRGGGRRAPAPLPRQDLATVAAGVGLWGLALVLLYALQASGAAAVPAWGVWTALGGTVLGGFGAYLRWRRDRGLRRDRPG